MTVGEILRDKFGNVVEVGHLVVWTEHGCRRHGIVDADAKYQGGLCIAGRSLKNVWEDCTEMMIVGKLP